MLDVGPYTPWASRGLPGVRTPRGASAHQTGRWASGRGPTNAYLANGDQRPVRSSQLAGIIGSGR